MADPGLGAKLITGQRTRMPAMIPTPAPGMDKSAQWCGVRGSENKGLPARTASATSALRPAKRCRRLTLLRPDLGRCEKPAYCSRVSHNAQPRGRQGGGNSQFIEGVRDGFHQAAPDGGLLRPRLRLGVGATRWNGFSAPGVLLAALIVVTLTQGLNGLKAPARNASPTATPSHS
jgi:hypothetical protein